jgi:hypothetical protein
VSSFSNVLSISSQQFIASSIGVGCNLPRYNLDVNGSINTSQNIYVNSVPVTVGSSPVGSITMYAGVDTVPPPTKWLFCRGQSLVKLDYGDLYNIIGILYGGTMFGLDFNLPNLGGRVPVGVGSSGGSIYEVKQTGGEEKHTLTIPEMPSHSHDVLDTLYSLFFIHFFIFSI